MMSEGKTPPRNLDTVLAQWPSAERTALEWDDSAEHVLSLIGSGDSGRLAKATGRSVAKKPKLVKYWMYFSSKST